MKAERGGNRSRREKEGAVNRKRREREKCE
jgi:hypothetical protein